MQIQASGQACTHGAHPGRQVLRRHSRTCSPDSSPLEGPPDRSCELARQMLDVFSWEHVWSDLQAPAANFDQSWPNLSYSWLIAGATFSQHRPKLRTTCPSLQKLLQKCSRNKMPSVVRAISQLLSGGRSGGEWSGEHCSSCSRHSSRAAGAIFRICDVLTNPSVMPRRISQWHSLNPPRIRNIGIPDPPDLKEKHATAFQRNANALVLPKTRQAATLSSKCLLEPSFLFAFRPNRKVLDSPLARRNIRPSHGIRDLGNYPTAAHPKPGTSPKRP